MPTNTVSNLSGLYSRKWPFDFNEEAAHILRHWLTCDIKKLTVSGLLSGFLGKMQRIHYNNPFKLSVLVFLHLLQ